MKLLIERISYSDKQTTGFLHVLNDKDEIQLGYNTLELGWENNQRSISCIPAGEYKVKKRFSKKFKNHFHVLDVPNRSYILIHAGNFYTDIRGCILVGTDFKDINGDGYLDLLNSKLALNKLLAVMPDEFTLQILGRE